MTLQILQQNEVGHVHRLAIHKGGGRDDAERRKQEMFFQKRLALSQDCHYHVNSRPQFPLVTPLKGPLLSFYSPFILFLGYTQLALRTYSLFYVQGSLLVGLGDHLGI